MFRFLLAVGSLISVAIALACVGDRSVSPLQPRPLFSTQTGCPWPGAWYARTPANEKEEEVFGHITSGSTAWSVALTARDAATTTNQATYYSEDLPPPVNFGVPCTSGGPGHVNTGAEWGWYGFGFDPQCVSLTDVTQNDPERHRSLGGAFPEAYEGHCLNAGRFTLTLNNGGSAAFVRPLDFLKYVNSGPRFIQDTTTNPQGAATADVLVDVAEGTGSAATPGLELSATLNPYDANWPILSLQQSAYRLPSNFWIRFSAGTSVPASGVTAPQLLVRYFWNWPTDLLDRSGFANTYQSNNSLIRVKSFNAGTRTVRMHLVQPYERPADPTDVSATTYGAVLDLPFNVYGPLTATISPNPATVMARNALQFTGGGSNGAGGNQYQWAFGDGSTATVVSPSHAYQVPGPKTVTFTKTDLYGFSVTATGSVIVTDPPPTSLAASDVTATTATVSWVNGNPGSTTTIQDRVTGAQNWTTGDTAAAGATTFGLTNLSACTSYDVNAYHVVAATTVIGLFRTPSVNGNACAPLNFAVVQCRTDVFHGHAAVYFDVAWTRGEFSTGSTYEIGQGTTNDPTSASIMESGPSSVTTTTFGPYATTDNFARYFWVRHKLSGGTGASTWAALADNPLRGSQPCLQ